MVSMRNLCIGVVFAVGSLGSAGAQAGAITVVNPSFEILPAGGLPIGACGTGCAYDEATPIPGWMESVSGQTGQFQPGPSSGNFAYFNFVPDGITVAYSNGFSISQTVAATAVAGATYTLMVDVGFRKDVPDPSTVFLVVNGNAILATGVAQQFSGNWSTYTASYTATAADAGKAISILLDSNGVQGDWDNVRLSSLGGVPEPASWAMMLIGFGAVGFAVRRKAKADTLAA